MITAFLQQYANAPFEEKVRIFNECSQQLYDFLGLEHPVLNVSLVPIETIKGNDYNPNKVAPPEMKLLKLSITKDGFTMPVVVAGENTSEEFVIVDGFHRRTVVDRSQPIKDSLKGYLPVVKLQKSIEERVTATVRHNMARGTHQVELTAKLVTLLKKHNWSNERIAKELGMDADEVLRLKQISGLAEAFADKEFSKAWE
ncbi:MAG: ParB-like nuclease domain-containing protein [Bacteroidia bacterium]|nr:ParB-like nuclease domain-containing protein [Bacteroidia bacterium]